MYEPKVVMATYPRVQVLDHGYVQYVDHMGSDLSVSRSARVSHNADWRAGEHHGSDCNLINYLWEHYHTTPFESVVFTFEVMLPIFVVRQWHRHRTWCLAGSSMLDFERPCDGIRYPMRLDDAVRKWQPTIRASRPQRQTNALWPRHRLQQMNLRAPGECRHIQDMWYSGEKRVFTLHTALGSVTASPDHEFKTPDGSARLGDKPEYVMAMAQVGATRSFGAPEFSSHELAHEHWVEVEDGYEVSSLGRVRSFWAPGGHQKQQSPTLKRQSVNGAGRAVVNVGGKVQQVSRLVARAFDIADVDDKVLHRNDNPFDNRPRNLYVGTNQDNTNDQYVNGGRARLREVPTKVLSIDRAGTEDTFDLTVDGDHWFCANGLVVHNSYNEVSGRYTKLPDIFYVPDVETIGTQSKKNKQARDQSRPKWGRVMTWIMRSSHFMSYCAYRLLLWLGCPRELARIVLPLSIYTRMFATVNLLNLLKFLTLRCDSHAQWEIQQYARAMQSIAQQVVPVAVATWGRYEMKMVERKEIPRPPGH